MTDADDRPFATYGECSEKLDARAQQGQFGALLDGRHPGRKIH